MLTFTPPAGFKDVSEYSFSGKRRHVVVRCTHELGSGQDLLSVATDYSSELREYLHADSSEISPINRRADGSSYVTVQATFGKQNATERSAFVLLANGTSLQLSLRSDAADAQAASEFLQLVNTVHAAPAAAQGQAMSVATPDESPVIHRAGPVLISLPAEYQNHTLLKFS